SCEQFGERLLSTLVPLLGGGVAGFYVADEGGASLRRVAGYGLSPRATLGGTVAVGTGLVGQCARERTAIVLAALPPEYLEIGSGLGAASPVQAVAFPVVSTDTLLGVLEIAAFRALDDRETTLLQEVLPVVALSLDN